MPRFVLCVLVLTLPVQADLVTYFQEVDITGDGNGINASAIANITTGPGWMDIAVQNTSPLGPVLANGYANPFITELEFKNLPSFTLDEDNSYVESLPNSYFSHGKNNAATLSASAVLLNYSIIPGDSPGMDQCFMGLDENSIKNDNTIASINVLDGSYIPQENYAEGFLNDDGSTYGTVFDSARFHFEFFETSTTPDGSFYTDVSTLTVKFAGGGDYSYKHTVNVPEPATITVFGLGALLLLKNKRRVKM